MRYVNDELYDGLVINRSIPGFILQTGGFTNVPPDPVNDPLSPSHFFAVPAFDPIINEPALSVGLSNIRGTIAMAKLPGDPDSATSEWFINLADNSANLDFQNEGFSVFGSVVDDGMNVADEIASFPVTDLSFIFSSGAFSAIPFADYDFSGTEAAFQKNLIMVLDVQSITRPIIRATPPSGFLGEAFVGDTTPTVLTLSLKNTGNEALAVNSVDTSSVTAPFSLQTEDCTTLPTLETETLSPSASCSIILNFSPTQLGVFANNITITYVSKVSAEEFSVTYVIEAEGKLGDPEIEIVASSDVGVSQVGLVSAEKKIIVGNTGLSSLSIDSISINGLGATDFSEVNDCVGAGNKIAVGDTCAITVTFLASTLGSSTAILTLNTNDPANPVVNVSLTGIGDNDADGIPSAEELSGPNFGDGNNDLDKDYLQNEVATFLATATEYITLVSDDVISLDAATLGVKGSTVLNEVVVVDEIPPDAPSGSLFVYGLQGFNVIYPNGFEGGLVQVAIYLPADAKPTQFYRFGPTPDNATSHWYDFAFDSTTNTGAKFLGKVSICPKSDPDPETCGVIERNVVLISFIDGQKGDDDLIADGKVTQGVGGISFRVISSSSGSAAYLWLSVLVLSMRLRINIRRFPRFNTNNYKHLS